MTTCLRDHKLSANVLLDLPHECCPGYVVASGDQSPMQEAQVAGTPRGVFAAESKTLKPLMDGVHGHALASAALLVSTARSDLS